MESESQILHHLSVVLLVDGLLVVLPEQLVLRRVLYKLRLLEDCEDVLVDILH